MIKTTWSFWILLIFFILNIVDMILRANGYKKTISWDGSLSDRMMGVVISIIYGVVVAIALGWL